MGRADVVAAEMIAQLPACLGSVYEKVVRETLISLVEDFFPFTAIGRWWDRADEIDVVAVNRDHDAILFCEVKATEKQVGTDILESLRAKAKKVKWGSDQRKEFYCLFSRKGFTAGMIAQARKEGVVLIQGGSIADLMPV